MNPRGFAPSAHYDRVTAAWRLLLGEELHYGVFKRGDEPLEVATRALTEMMIAAVDAGAGDRVLDVGCGVGAPGCWLAAVTQARVTGISTSARGIAEATERAAAEGLGELLDFEVRDGMSNGFPDSSFDRVWVLESSHLMRRRDRLLSECSRVLRPRGRIALCDITLAREMTFSEVRARRRELALLRDVFGDARMERLEVYERLADEAGLAVERTADLTDETRPTFDRWRENAERHAGEVEALLSGQELRAFVGACDVLARYWDEGTLGYSLLSATKP